ncbi:MAG: ATPase domain-containing protein [Nitrososphaerales archaeon]
MTTIDSLLSDAVQAILIKGEPGCGKSTFVLELLRAAGGGVYISTRVSREKLLGQIPGVRELLISNESTQSPEGTVEMGDMRLATPGDVLRQMMEGDRRPAKELVVLDSWDGIAKEVSNVDRVKIEKTLLVVAESRNKKLVFISEEPEETTISYLVDAIVTLTKVQRDGAVVRTIETEKLRGGPILRPKSLFTLAGGRFREFEEGPPNPAIFEKRADFRPILHSEHAFSSGMEAFDEGSPGGWKKGNVDLLEFGENLNSAVHYGTYNIIFCNFILNGGCALKVPGGGGKYAEIAQLAKLILPAESVQKNLAIGVFEKYDDPCFFSLSSVSIEDCFGQLWTKMADLKGRTKRPLIMMIGLDTLESLFGERELLYYLSRTCQLIRRNADLLTLTCGYSSKLGGQLKGLCDFHAKFEIIDDSLTVHSINPPGPIVHINYDYTRGFPYPMLTPVL